MCEGFLYDFCTLRVVVRLACVMGGWLLHMVGLLARVDLLRLGTRVALDEAAPVEATVAPLLHHLLLSRVPAATAHGAAAVGSLGGLVAGATLGPEDASAHVVGAVVGRRVQEDEVFRCWNDGPPAPDLQLPSLPQANFRCSVVLLLQVVTDFSEAGQLLPASHQGTGARDAMALARHACLLDHRLSRSADREEREQTERKRRTD